MCDCVSHPITTYRGSKIIYPASPKESIDNIITFTENDPVGLESI